MQWYVMSSYAMKKIEFKEFGKIALDAGVKINTLRQWKKRKTIPYQWRLRIFEHTNGAISLQHMAELFHSEIRTERGDAE